MMALRALEDDGRASSGVPRAPDSSEVRLKRAAFALVSTWAGSGLMERGFAVFLWARGLKLGISECDSRIGAESWLAHFLHCLGRAAEGGQRAG